MQRQLVTFLLGSGLFGIDVLLIREINRGIDVTKVSPSPDYVEGLMNLRGQIVTILNPSQRLGIKSESVEEHSCIILKTKNELERHISEGLIDSDVSKEVVGLRVDAIAEMVMVNDDEMEQAPANVGGIEAAYIKGIVKLENNLLVVLNLPKVLHM